MAAGDAVVERAARFDPAASRPLQSDRHPTPPTEARLSLPFVTLKSPHRAEIRDQGSVFVATAVPAGDVQAVRDAIQAVREEFPDATHHAWASTVRGPDGAGVDRCHDAGEPAGTAGPPILQAIRGAGMSNVAVIVSRWFGGTKLGKGGLARAYRAAATAALQDAPRVTAERSLRLRIAVPQTHEGEARALVARHRGRVLAATYDEPGRSVLEVAIAEAAFTRLRDGLQDMARGTARLSVIE